MAGSPTDRVSPRDHARRCGAGAMYRELRVHVGRRPWTSCRSGAWSSAVQGPVWVDAPRGSPAAGSRGAARARGVAFPRCAGQCGRRVRKGHAHVMSGRPAVLVARASVLATFGSKIVYCGRSAPATVTEQRAVGGRSGPRAGVGLRCAKRRVAPVALKSSTRRAPLQRHENLIPPGVTRAFPAHFRLALLDKTWRSPAVRAEQKALAVRAHAEDDAARAREPGRGRRPRRGHKIIEHGQRGDA